MRIEACQGTLSRTEIQQASRWSMADYQVRSLLSIRAQSHIYSIWRPLVDVVNTHPLAVCDSRTLSKEDLVACDMMYPDITTEIYHVLYNPEQRWFYLPAQRNDEALLMKNFDSDLSICEFDPHKCQSGTNTYSIQLGCAHTAIDDPSSSSGATKRRSIEVRCWVFYAEQDESPTRSDKSQQM